MSRTVLVTGGAGYLGSTVVEALLQQAYSVRVIDALCFGGAALLPFGGNSRFEFLHGDIRDRSRVQTALNGVDTVVHLAAVVGDPACARQPVEAQEVNVDATAALFEESCRANVSGFLLASTCSAYGATESSNTLADENTELAPLSFYARTKVECEELVLKEADRSRPAVTALRLATLYGVSARMRFDLTVNDFTMQMFTNRQLTVHAAETWRPYVHVRDAARAVCTVLSAQDKARQQIYNVGSTAQNYRKADIVRMAQTQIPEATVEYKEQSVDRRNYRVSFDKIEKQFHFQACRTVVAAISEIVHLLRSGVISHPNDPIFHN